MGRLVRNTAILAKVETTYGTDATPVGASDAMLVSNLSPNPINANNVDRDLIRPYLGGSEQLVGTRYVELSFDVEISGAGTVAIAPAYAPLLRACGFAGTATATTRYDFSLLTNNQESATIYWYDDGVLHKLTGARGDVTFKMGVGERPVMSFKFTGIYSTPTAASNPSVTLTGFQTPQVITDANTGDIVFGATHSTSTAPAFTGGTQYPSQGIEITLGNSVQFTPLLGGETVDITQRAASGKVTLDLTAAQEVALMANVEAATLQTLGLIHGTLANRRFGVWAPAVQLFNPQPADVNGKRLVSFDLRLVPASGNDELRLFTSF